MISLIIPPGVTSTHSQKPSLEKIDKNWFHWIECLPKGKLDRSIVNDLTHEFWPILSFSPDYVILKSNYALTDSTNPILISRNIATLHFTLFTIENTAQIHTHTCHSIVNMLKRRQTRDWDTNRTHRSSFHKWNHNLTTHMYEPIDWWCKYTYSKTLCQKWSRNRCRVSVY